jgi:hypothetical protein
MCGYFRWDARWSGIDAFHRGVGGLMGSWTGMDCVTGMWIVSSDARTLLDSGLDFGIVELLGPNHFLHPRFVFDPHLDLGHSLRRFRGTINLLDTEKDSSIDWPRVKVAPIRAFWGAEGGGH